MAYLDKGVDQVGAGRALGHHLQVKKNHYDDKDYARWSSPKVRHGSCAPVVHAIRSMLHGVLCTLYDAAACRMPSVMRCTLSVAWSIAKVADTVRPWTCVRWCCMHPANESTMCGFIYIPRSRTTTTRPTSPRRSPSST